MEFDDLHVEISGTHTVQEEHDSSGNNTPTHAPPSNAAPGTVAAVPKSSNVFIAGLPSTWGTSRLKDLLQPFGTLVSVRVVSDRHYAFAQFSTVEAAQACIKALHDTKVSPSSNTTLHVCFAIHSEGTEEVPNSRLFVRGLPPFATKEDLRRIGAPFGVVVDASVIVHPDGKCKGSGFIAFDDVDAATACLTRLSGKLIPFGDPLQPQARGCELVFKYCETDEQRAMRIKSNKDRINRRPPSVASTTPSSGLHRDGALESPHPQTAIAAFGIGARSILPSTETNTIGRSGTPQSGSSRRVRQHDNPLSVDIVVPSAPVAVNTLFLRAPTPAFPRGGDVLMTAPSLTAQQARELMAGVIDAPLLVCPFRNGFALRLSKPELHQVALDALHETVFANGERLRVELLITA